MSVLSDVKDFDEEVKAPGRGLISDAVLAFDLDLDLDLSLEAPPAAGLAFQILLNEPSSITYVALRPCLSAKTQICPGLKAVLSQLVHTPVS